MHSLPLLIPTHQRGVVHITDQRCLEHPLLLSRQKSLDYWYLNKKLIVTTDMFSCILVLKVPVVFGRVEFGLPHTAGGDNQPAYLEWHLELEVLE